MEFNFSHNKDTVDDIYVGGQLELWSPIEENPKLNDNEVSLLFGEEEVTDSFHIALPSLITNLDGDEFGYTPCFELDRYYVVAKLKHSPYMVFFEEKIASKQMKKHLIEKFRQNRSNFYLFDAFFEPLFAGISPKHFLFQKVSFDTVPESVILFREIEENQELKTSIFLK
jgi:hypothetical protein